MKKTILLIIILIILVVLLNISKLDKVSVEDQTVVLDPLVTGEKNPVATTSLTTPRKPAVSKYQWGNCKESIGQKLPFNFDNLKKAYAGAVESNHFGLRFFDNAQVRLRDGHLVSLCGADLTETNTLIESSGFIVSRTNQVSEELVDQWSIKTGINLNSDYVIKIPTNTNIEAVISTVKSLYNQKIIERVSLMPIPAALPN